MKIILSISAYIIPLIIFTIVIYGIVKKENVYDDFIEGAKDGMKTVVKVMPTLIGLMVGVGMLRESGFMKDFGNMMGKITDKIGFPGELFPISIVKIFSSSAATGMLLDLYKTYGVDSYISNIASIMLSSTETIFYTMSVYFISAKVTKTRWTLQGALLATLGGTVASVMVAKYL